MFAEPTTASATLRHLRWALLALTAMACIGAFLELAALQHWRGSQLIAWVVTAIVLVGVPVFVFVRARWAVWAARTAGLVGLVGATIGMWEHVETNMETAVLSSTWSAAWESLPVWEQFWYAVSGQAGPSPALAPGMLGLAGALLLVATWGMRPIELQEEHSG